MKFEAHCQMSLTTFSDSFSQVHLFLDEFSGAPGIGMRHRQKRHHLAGIEEVRPQFGDMAAEAAWQHIESDLREEGWKLGEHFPTDERDYVRMGLY